MTSIRNILFKKKRDQHSLMYIWRMMTYFFHTHILTDYSANRFNTSSSYKVTVLQVAFNFLFWSTGNALRSSTSGSRLTLVYRNPLQSVAPWTINIPQASRKGVNYPWRVTTETDHSNSNRPVTFESSTSTTLKG